MGRRINGSILACCGLLPEETPRAVNLMVTVKKRMEPAGPVRYGPSLPACDPRLHVKHVLPSCIRFCEYKANFRVSKGPFVFLATF